MKILYLLKLKKINIIIFIYNKKKEIELLIKKHLKEGVMVKFIYKFN